MLRTSKNTGRVRTRAFTLIEVILAATIGIIFSFVVLASLTSVTSMSSDLYEQASSESSGRAVIDIASRALRNAAPLASCRDIPEQTTMAGCRQLDMVPRSDAFLKATDTQAYFFSYATTREAGDSVVPDLVTITAVAPGGVDGSTPGWRNDDNWSLCVNVYRWNGTNPFTAWLGTNAATITALVPGNAPGGSTLVESASRCAGPVGKPDAVLVPLRYLSSTTGTYLSSPVTELKNIRLVELNLALSYTASDKYRYVKPTQLLVTVNSSVLR